ncbi:MAG: hypothetical protein R8G66_33365 [Cytophagales bacterium]|nr:hypothetical protein [Cytophagales bacterium]
MSKKVSRFAQWWTRFTNFEFWSFNVFYFPVKIYYAFLALRSRSLFFFTASNPSIEFGGMLGEKKSEIFDLIPDEYMPVTRLFTSDVSTEEVMTYLQQSKLSFPIIAKPDVGERGWMVSKLNSEEELSKYLKDIQVNFLIQEFIDYPLELGVFYIKVPGEARGRVTSIVKKGFLSVSGDGENSVKELLEQNVRAMLQVEFDSPEVQEIATDIPKNGEEVLVEAIGNHCRGTTFLNYNHWIDEALHSAFDQISSQIKDFYFGRFDLRCDSIESLREIKQFKILELNGAGAEPGHVYHPGSSIFAAYRDILWHLKMLRRVSAANRKRGHQYWKFSDGIRKMREISAYNQQKESNT